MDSRKSCSHIALNLEFAVKYAWSISYCLAGHTAKQQLTNRDSFNVAMNMLGRKCRNNI